MTAASEAGGLRDRLLGRKRPSQSVPIAVADVTAPSRDVAIAEDAWRTTHLMPQGEDRTKAIRGARRDLDKAIAALDACYATVTVRALPPEDFEAMVSAHPPRDAKETAEGEIADEVWNGRTFPRALFLECAPGDLSRAEWESFLDDQCSRAERDQLYAAALSVNIRTPSAAVPKD